MKTFYIGLIVLFFFLIVQNSNAQNRFDIELYGGINKNYFQAGESATNPDLQFSSSLGQHVGFNFLPRISQDWQLSIQTEWMRSAISLEIPSFVNIRNQYNHYGNYAIGVRYNLEKEKNAIYFQPSVDISMNNYLDSLVDGFIRCPELQVPLNHKAT
ncbi:hypothetical protein [Aquiflexum sp.]|uniref:hypothetical protein n=1 Tax=Aquiflexum sp. TaxID=1872584 RepID=UPI0035936DEE